MNSYLAWQRKQINPLVIPNDVLYWRMMETVMWCNLPHKAVMPFDSLRTPNLLPYLFSGDPDDAVCDVGRSRGYKLKDNVPSEQLTLPNLEGGRFAVFFPDGNLSDGAAGFYSNGFFDGYNVPPWDTWIAFFDDGPNSASVNNFYPRYLLAYVPSYYVTLAGVGMEVNPEQCIAWLDDVDVKLRQRL